MNQGLSDADFDHDTPKESAAEPGTKAAPAAVAAPKKGGKRVKNKPAKVCLLVDDTLRMPLWLP